MNTNHQNIRKSAQLLGSICGGLLISLPAFTHTAVAQQLNPKVNPCPSIFYEEPHNNRVLVPQGCPPNALTQRMTQQGLLPVSPDTATPSPYQTRLGVGGEAPSPLNPNPSVFNEPPYDRSQGTLQPEGSLTPTPRPTPGEQTLVPQPGESTVPTRPPFSTQPPAPEQQTPSTRIALVNGRVNVKLVNDTGANVTYEVIGDTPARSLEGKSNVTLEGLTAPATVTFRREDGGLLSVTPRPSSQSGMLEVTLKETTDFGQDRSALRIQETGAVFLN